MRLLDIKSDSETTNNNIFFLEDVVYIYNEFDLT